jgi:hypothetical protein
VDGLEWPFSNLDKKLRHGLSHQIECGAEGHRIVCELRSSSVLLHLIFTASDSTLVPFRRDYDCDDAKIFSDGRKYLGEAGAYSIRNTRTEILDRPLRSRDWERHQSVGYVPIFYDLLRRG